MNKVTAKDCELTEAQRNLIENFENVPTKGKMNFGLLQAKSYCGKNQTVNLARLNELKKEQGKKYIGSLSQPFGETAWYLYAIDGKTYRIPEPIDGIDSILDIEFKRTKIE